jgi:hypothetical protein
MIFFGEVHLCRILIVYAAYYNEVRTHLSLGKDAPSVRRPETVGSIIAMPILAGLHHQYVRV